MIERKIYDLIEQASTEEHHGSFGTHLLDSLFASFSRDLAFCSGELWARSKNEIRRVEARGELRSPIAPEWMQVHFKRHKKLNPFWFPGSESQPPAVVVTFGKKQRSFLVFHFIPNGLETDREKIEASLMLITQLVTMFVQKHEERNQLQEILALSMRQQQRILPRGFPCFPGYQVFGQSEPAEEVGGDYFSLDLLSPEVLGIAIADAKGKGFIAAVQITALHRCLRLLHREPLKLTAKMERLNQVFGETGEDRDPISAVLGELHQDGRFLYVNASHPYPLLCRRGQLMELTEGGLFIGLMPEAKYRFGLVELEPKDILCLYTDGVSESERGDQDHLPEVKSLLLNHGDRPLQELSASILELSRNREYGDDRTILLIRRQ